MSVPSIKLVGSDFRGTKVLVIDPDLGRAQLHEAQSEITPKLQRIDLYFATSLEEGRDFARRFNCDLAIFPDGLGDSDFVNTQIELRHARPEIQMIAIVTEPTLAQLRSSKRIGGIYDFAEPTILEDFDLLTSSVLNFLRDSSRITDSQTAIISYTTPLQACLLIKNKYWTETKKKSQNIINNLVLDFDLSNIEIAKLLSADQIFLPWLSGDEYRIILGKDPFSLSEILEQAGLWGDTETQVKTVPGFILTASTWLAEKQQNNDSVDSILHEINRQPIFLRCSAIKLLTEEKIRALLNLSNSRVQNG